MIINYESVDHGTFRNHNLYKTNTDKDFIHKIMKIQYRRHIALLFSDDFWIHIG